MATIREEENLPKEEGIELGKKEGIELGEKNKTKEIAKNMLKDNVDINTIKKYTNLTEEELTALEEE